MEKKRKSSSNRKAKARKPKVRIPLPFEKAVEGLLAVTPEKAKKM